MSPSVARLIEQEEEWKAEVEADIAMKESRIKILQMEKEDRIAQVRVHHLLHPFLTSGSRPKVGLPSQLTNLSSFIVNL